MAEERLNLPKFLLEYRCACVLEQEVEQRLMGEEAFS